MSKNQCETKKKKMTQKYPKETSLHIYKKMNSGFFKLKKNY